MISTRMHIANLPTPVEHLTRLSNGLGGPVIYCKRDDMTGLAFGGNKIRKLEFVMTQAQKTGSKTLVTVGAIQSNHCRQTAALAARCGLDCILVLSGDEPDMAGGNLLLDHLLGAEIVWTTREKREEKLLEVFNHARDHERKPFLIPLGASDPIGTLGYAQAMHEFSEQDTQVDWMVVASSSGGTQAGMVLGARQTQFKGRILGISIDHSTSDLQMTVANLANEASAHLGENQKFLPIEILVKDDYLGGGYGVMAEPEIEAIRLFAKYEGLFLDPVYTSRAAAGMIDLIRKGFFTRQDRILFWHTGGTPALFSAPYQDQLNIK